MNMKVALLRGKMLTKPNIGVGVRFLDAEHTVSANDKAGQTSPAWTATLSEAPQRSNTRYDSQS